MKIRHRIGTALAKVMKRANLVGPGAWQVFGSILGGSGVSGKLRIPGVERPAENILYAYTAMMARCDALAQTQLRISDDNDNIIEGGTLYDLLARPSSLLDGVQFVSAIESYLTIFNMAAIVPVAETKQRPDELMLLSPQYMQPIVGVHKATGVRITMGWRYREPGGVDHMFLRGEVIVIQVFNPHNPIMRLDPMGPLKRSLQMDSATRDQNLAIFLNGGMPDIALESDRDWNDDQAKEFLQRFVDTYGGTENAHKIAMLYNGVKIVKVGLNPEELQSLDVLKNLTPHEICSGLRVKPVMAGIFTSENGLSQGTSTDEQKIAWWGEVGNGELARIAAALQQFLVDPFDWSDAKAARHTRAMTSAERHACHRARAGVRPHLRASNATRGKRLFIWFDTSNVPELLEHRWKRIESFDKLASRGYRPNDLNDYFDLGLPAHPTDVGLVPFNVQPVADVVSVAPAARSVDPQPRALPPVHDTRSLDLLTRVESIVQARAAELAAKWKTLRKKFDKFIEQREQAAAKKWSRFYMEQRGRVAERLTATRGQRDAEELSGETEGLLERIFPRDEENSHLLARLTPLWTTHLEDGWESLNEEHSIEGNAFTIDDPNVFNAIEARKLQGVKANDTTEAALRDILKTAFAEGDTVSDLSDRLAGYYNDHCVGPEKHRPLTAARTMTAGIVNDGRMAAAESAGGLRKGWLHGAPDEPRPEHQEAQAKYLDNPIPMDEDFQVGGVTMKSPGDANAPIEHTANCTCMVVFGPATQTEEGDTE